MVILLAVLVFLGLAHALILRLLAWPLVARELSQPQADFYCLHGDEYGADGFEPFDHAAAWYAEAPNRQILLLSPRDSRVVETGAVRSLVRTCRSELDKRRIPAADVLAIRVESRDVWGEAHAMADWLTAHPRARVVLACSPFRSGWLQYVFNKVLGPVNAERMRLAMLPDPECRVGSWWRSREGVKDFMYAWLDLFYAWAEGENAGPLPAGAAAFQEEIRAKIGEAPP